MADSRLSQPDRKSPVKLIAAQAGDYLRGAPPCSDVTVGLVVQEQQHGDGLPLAANAAYQAIAWAMPHLCSWPVNSPYRRQKARVGVKSAAWHAEVLQPEAGLSFPRCARQNKALIVALLHSLLPQPHCAPHAPLTRKFPCKPDAIF